MNWKTLQEQHRAWIGSMYPDQPPELPAAGCVEEASELLHAVLAVYRHTRWGPDPRYTEEKLRHDVEDAVGDCAIYAVSLCNALKVDAEPAFRWVAGVPWATGRTASAAAVELVMCAGRVYSSLPEPYNALRIYLVQLYSVADTLGVDVAACVANTWNRVKERKRESTAASVLQPTGQTDGHVPSDQ